MDITIEGELYSFKLIIYYIDDYGAEREIISSNTESFTYIPDELQLNQPEKLKKYVPRKSKFAVAKPFVIVTAEHRLFFKEGFPIRIP
jgi:hypothetical protein